MAVFHGVAWDGKLSSIEYLKNEKSQQKEEG